MNKIILHKDSGRIVNIVFDNSDLSQTTADLNARLLIDEKTKAMVLQLDIQLNDKFEITFKE